MAYSNLNHIGICIIQLLSAWLIAVKKEGI